MAPAAIFILALVIYTGFAIPTRDMHPWFRWLNWINPVAYGFESLMINEVCCCNYVELISPTDSDQFHDRKIPCSPAMFVPAGPAYLNISPDERICSTTGAAAGADFVDGDTYINVNFEYYYSHLWRYITHNSKLHSTC
jgi:ATP-binding cassette, subfamily G (WHITE), member 2, PDR